MLLFLGARVSGHLFQYFGFHFSQQIPVFPREDFRQISIRWVRCGEGAGGDEAEKVE